MLKAVEMTRPCPEGGANLHVPGGIECGCQNPTAEEPW